MQNKCFRTIVEAFRVTLISMLKAKIYIFFMNAHLDQLQMSIKIRLRFEEHQTLIANACKAIVKKLRDKARRRQDQKSISNDEKHN
jgi:hypothetical protein